MKIIAALGFVVFAAGCAAGGANRPVVVGVAAVAPANAYVLDNIELRGVRLGEVSASREWQRGAGDSHAVARDDADQLRDQLAGDLGRVLPLQPTAALHLRVAVTLQDTADYEGFAAETSDVTLSAAVLDDQGVVLRTITLREPASAPLQRSASQRARLDSAFDRLSRRLAQQL